uniref:Uncharacterized protein n=1 Tax=Romanomermis culicivorax TaxID=13658 RepID=A0A915K8L7_ROMCU
MLGKKNRTTLANPTRNLASMIEESHANGIYIKNPIPSKVSRRRMENDYQLNHGSHGNKTLRICSADLRKPTKHYIKHNKRVCNYCGKEIDRIGQGEHGLRDSKLENHFTVLRVVVYFRRFVVHSYFMSIFERGPQVGKYKRMSQSTKHQGQRLEPLTPGNKALRLLLLPEDKAEI